MMMHLRGGSAAEKQQRAAAAPKLQAAVAVLALLLVWSVAFPRGRQRVDASQDDGDDTGGCGPDPDPCATYNFTFIAGSGRSGSTTLLHTLNLLPGYLLRGENQQAFNSVYDAYTRATKFPGLRGIQGSFFNNVSDDTLVCASRQFVMGILNPPQGAAAPRVLGFKEVHFSRGMLLFLKRLFPCARFVLNVRRDLNAQARSAYHKHEARETVEAMHAELMRFHARHKLYTWLIALEDFAAANSSSSSTLAANAGADDAAAAAGTTTPTDGDNNNNTAAMNRLFAWLGYPHCRATRIPHFNKNGTYLPDLTVPNKGSEVAAALAERANLRHHKNQIGQARDNPVVCGQEQPVTAAV